ncbi:BQ2448_4567 [Microbotryum intermedium]|uniref:BQ2448_4567 protein n=1 Tax=Microbotryum intermedium TaxID=269621 RepID=A0A238FIP4_9BASI|nr:BQ2448_4567 [Microbotryum intermedium]
MTPSGSDTTANTPSGTESMDGTSLLDVTGPSVVWPLAYASRLVSEDPSPNTSISIDPLTTGHGSYIASPFLSGTLLGMNQSTKVDDLTRKRRRADIINRLTTRIRFAKYKVDRGWAELPLSMVEYLTQGPFAADRLARFEAQANRRKAYKDDEPGSDDDVVRRNAKLQNSGNDFAGTSTSSSRLGGTILGTGTSDDAPRISLMEEHQRYEARNHRGDAPWISSMSLKARGKRKASPWKELPRQWRRSTSPDHGEAYPPESTGISYTIVPTHQFPEDEEEQSLPQSYVDDLGDSRDIPTDPECEDPDADDRKPFIEGSSFWQRIDVTSNSNDNSSKDRLHHGPSVSPHGSAATSTATLALTLSSAASAANLLAPWGFSQGTGGTADTPMEEGQASKTKTSKEIVLGKHASFSALPPPPPLEFD